MELSNQNILFLTRTMDLGGTENVILQLCEIFKPRVNKIVVCSCGGINVEKIEQIGIEHYNIPDIAKKSPTSVLNVIKTVKKIIKEEQITVIHSHHRMAAMYAQILSRHDMIKIANAHNTFLDKRFLTKFAYRNTNIVAVGEMVKKNLTDDVGIGSSQISVIHNSVKQNKDIIEELPEIKEYRMKGKYIIGNIGRLSEQKGMEYYILASQIVHNKYPNTCFFIIGDGEDKQKLLDLVHEKKMEDYVIFLGYKDNIQNIMRQLDFIVLSSLWEGLPLTPIEAFSVGKTVVATAVDGTIEIVEDAVNGCLVEKKNYKQLAEKMIYLIENPEKKMDMEKNALNRYFEEFSYEKMSLKYIKYYEEL